MWLEKSLSEARDSEEETMSISVQSVSSSFIRGQNVPIDPFTIAEREVKRRKAMELQQAIKEQLEERDNLKKLERERQWQQEKLEEDRLARQMDIEKRRLEKERQMQNEKLENERKKEEVMRKALEKAAIEAQKERERKRKDRALALQSSLDETISIQKIGERTEIYIEGCQKPLSSSMLEATKDIPEKRESEIEPVNEKNKNISPVKYSNNNNTKTDTSDNSDNTYQENEEEKDDNGDDDDDDGETVLIGTPIKLKKKNLENFRRKFHKRQQQKVDELKTSDEEISTPKTIKSTDSNVTEKNSEKTAATMKTISDLEGIAFVMQTMPIVPTFVHPLNTNEMFGFNQLSSLAFLMAAQNRLNSPNVMLPIISRDISSTPSANEKLDLSQFIIPSSNPSTITLQFQQVDNNFMRQNVAAPIDDDKIKSVPPTPDLQQQQQQSVPHSPPQKDIDESVEKFKIVTPSTIPHDGTFTKEDCTQADAVTSTENGEQYCSNNNEIKILTPKKYRTIPKMDKHARTVSTQTESFLFCEYCSYQHHQHSHHHGCSHSIMDESNITASSDSNNNNNNKDAQPEIISKPKEKQNPTETRPKWGVRNPPRPYLKASERDPFYGRTRKKRYLKKAASESEKNDEDSCSFKECPLIKSPLLSKRSNKQQQNRENLCSNLLPIKTDRFGRVCLVDEQNFIMKEAIKRYNHRSDYASDTESSSTDVKHKSFFLPRANDFKDIFVD